MATLEELKIEATAEIEAAKPQYISVNNEKRERTEAEYAQAVTDLTNLKWQKQEYGYQRDRALEYPSIADQLDDIFHNGLDGWKATIQETKDKYPKG